VHHLVGRVYVGVGCMSGWRWRVRDIQRPLDICTVELVGIGTK
jgi:hypothetical protein